MKNSIKPQVGIIIGGKSVEHDISVLSGLQAKFAIDEEKYDVTVFYLTKDNHWLIGEDLNTLSTYQKGCFDNCKEIVFYPQNNKSCYHYLDKPKKEGYIDIFIPVVHGAGMEDGTLCAYLELINATYTCAKITASSLAQDKVFTKEILTYHQLPVIAFRQLSRSDFSQVSITNIVQTLSFPLIVKPATLGSSIGIEKCKDMEEFQEAVHKSFTYGNKMIIEKALDNYREFNCAILKDGMEYHISCVEEVMPSSDILSFIDKYENELNKLSSATNRIIPAVISKELEVKIKTLALKSYQILEMSGVVRIDFLYDNESETIYLNEINTIPGSLAFYLFEKEGITFTKLINILIKNALFEKQQKEKLVTHFNSNVLSKKSIKLKN